MGFLYDTDVATMERVFNRVLYLTLGVLLLPPLLIALAIVHRQWHPALVAPIVLPFPAAYLALRAKRAMSMGMCLGACALLVVGTPALAGLLALAA
ncbi:hypothetical protein AB0C96_20840 [Streptomyces sp. NPDC048506]|uniref:hypothetical protein n=1 Tax=Streptomyces sp. NPDC048506 TaxID=3155028 RepID=UPI00342640A5